jgi:hypothetical protein
MTKIEEPNWRSVPDTERIILSSHEFNAIFKVCCIACRHYTPQHLRCMVLHTRTTMFRALCSSKVVRAHIGDKAFLQWSIVRSNLRLRPYSPPSRTVGGHIQSTTPTTRAVFSNKYFQEATNSTPRYIGLPARGGFCSRTRPRVHWPMSSEITAGRMQFNYSTAEDKNRHIQALDLNAGIKAKSSLG